MELKRQYAREENGAPLVKRDANGQPIMRQDGFDPQTGEPVLRPVFEEPIGVEVISLGASQDQHFAPDLVEQGLRQGWILLDLDPKKGKPATLTIKATNGDYPYEVVRLPGYYCLHCAEKIDFDDKGVNARIHVASKHAGKASPDANWPHGYERINYFDCVEINPRPEKE